MSLAAAQAALAPAPSGAPAISGLDRSSFERWVQSALNAVAAAFGTPCGGVEVNGSLRGPTRPAVRGFQRHAKKLPGGHRLAVDGIVGRHTTAALEGVTRSTAPTTREAHRKRKNAAAAADVGSRQDALKPGGGDRGAKSTATDAHKKTARAKPAEPAESYGAAAFVPLPKPVPKPVPKPAPKPADKAATEPAPLDVKGLIQRLDTVLPPISVLDKTSLALGTLTRWPAERGRVLAQALETFAKLPAGADRASLEAAVTRAAKFVADVLARDGKRVRDHAIKLVNDASVLKEPAKQPTLPPRSDVRAYQAGLRAVGAAAGDPLLAKSGLKDAVTVAQDGALAIFQGLSVLAARATWKQGVVEPGARGVKAANRDKDNPLKRIFKDAGWGAYISTTKHKDRNGKETKKVADWCGMFVGAHLFRGGGLDEELRSGFLHTSNVLDYFNYTQKANRARAPKSIWAEGLWHNLKDYHGARGSLRKWTPRAAVKSTLSSGAALDVRPGDVVLIDRSGKKKSPQHITMVESYDPKTKTLTTIEGNTGGIQAPDGKVTDKAGAEHWMRHKKRADGVGVHTRDLGDMGRPSPKAERGQAYKGRKGSTVFGIGRPSVVDFEEHTYATLGVPKGMEGLSPKKMRALANKKTKQGKKAKMAQVHEPV